MPARGPYRLLLLVTALLFSTGGAAIKSAHLTSWQVASFRSFIAAGMLAVLVPVAGRYWSRRVLLVACAYAFTLVSFVLATKATTAANAIFLQSAAPLYVMMLSPWLLGERIRRSDLVFGAALVAGLSLFFVGSQGAEATAPYPVRGNILAACSGVAWALSVMGLRWLSKSGNPAGTATVVAGNVIAALATLPMALPVVRPAAEDLWVLLYLGTVQVGLAYYCMARALRHVPAFEASTLLLLEPVLNPVWAWIVHGEKPGWWAAAGGAIIIGATFVHTWRASRAVRVYEPVP